jgi:hypothetical protein
MMLGNHSYDQPELMDILSYPGFPGDGLNPLARELIAAKLNIANEAGHECVDGFITQADLIIGDLVPKPVGNDTIPIGNVQNLINDLASYNKGELCCAEHCALEEDQRDQEPSGRGATPIAPEKLDARYRANFRPANQKPSSSLQKF